MIIYSRRQKLQITKDRRKRVIDLYFNQHKTYAEIAQIEKMSPRDIHAIIKEEETRRQKHKHQQQLQDLSSKAYKLFSKKKPIVEVATILNLREPQVTKYNREYWKLKGLDKLNIMHKETNGNTWPVWKLYQQLVKKRRLSIEQVVNAVDTDINKLPYMETLYKQLKDEVDKLQYIRQGLANDMHALERKISALDKTAFSCELECRRTKQKIQELTAKKDRIEELIATMLSDDKEDYTKLKAIVKEIVKDVLSDNKTLISIAFAALIQTLKTDPQIVKLIQNMPSVNDSEQYKDNNNITKYLESNRDSILDLAEKNYENLVEAFTKNAIDTAASSPSNPASSLSQSSSTFLNPSTQSYTYRKEEPEIYDNSKGDIVE